MIPLFFCAWCPKASWRTASRAPIWVQHFDVPGTAGDKAISAARRHCSAAESIDVLERVCSAVSVRRAPYMLVTLAAALRGGGLDLNRLLRGWPWRRLDNCAPWRWEDGCRTSPLHSRQGQARAVVSGVVSRLRCVGPASCGGNELMKFLYVNFLSPPLPQSARGRAGCGTPADFANRYPSPPVSVPGRSGCGSGSGWNRQLPRSGVENAEKTRAS